MPSQLAAITDTTPSASVPARSTPSASGARGAGSACSKARMRARGAVDETGRLPACELPVEAHRALRGHRDAELAQDGGGVEVDPLAGEAVPAAPEDEESDHGAAELTPRRERAEESPALGPEQVELDDHRIVRVPQRAQLVALVGERRARRRVVLLHRLRAVEHLTRGHDLVARVREGRERGGEVLVILRLHVLADDRLAAIAQCGRRG